MTKSTQIPEIKTVRNHIQTISPEGSKCIQADFMTIQGLSILAWVVDIPCSKTQGYYQAFGSIYQKGEFTETAQSMPCQYYGQNATSSSVFEANGATEKQDLISIENNYNEVRAKITLVCKGKTSNQILIRVPNEKVRS